LSEPAPPSSQPAPARLEDSERPTIAVANEFGPSTVRPLQPLQRAALWVALGLGVLIVIIAAPLTIGWLVYAPQPPRLEGLTQEQVVAAVATYRELVQIHENAAQARFDTIILKALLPILTLTLGYVFGSQQRRD
jgi:hypothetical protein